MAKSPQPAGVQRLLGDIVELCELQWQLLSVDSEEAKRRAVRSAIFLAVALILAISGLMAGVLGLGWLLHEQTALSPGGAFLVTCAIALTCAGIAGYIALRMFSKANESLGETKRELAENVRWLKAVILSPKTSARHQLRHNSFSTDRVPVDESRFQHMH